MATLARPVPAPQDSAKTDTTWLLQKVRKILDTTVAVMGDKGYDSDKLRVLLAAAGVEPVIPTRANKRNRPPFNRERYRQRNLIERFLGQIKENRRVATRYDKKASHYEAFIVLAALKCWLKIIC